MTTESQIATPPSIAVGFLCQRSVFGAATKPKRRAAARTNGVSINAKQKEAATARGVRELKDIASHVKAQPQMTRRNPDFSSVLSAAASFSAADTQRLAQGHHRGSF